MSLFLSLAVLNRESGSTRVCLPRHLRAVLPGAWQRNEFGEIHCPNFLAFWGKAQNRCSRCLWIFQGTYIIRRQENAYPAQRAHFPADKILLRYKILAEKNTNQKILVSWIFPVCNLLVQVTEDEWHFRSPFSLLASTCLLKNNYALTFNTAG